tara:strand:- start:118 stop:582 length:465 start_codon:yes stop_codon:yes gene_type:complete
VTEVRLIGTEHVDLFETLMEYEVSRNALSPYSIIIPFENSIDLTTISLGAAVSLLNDLSWYLSRYVKEALVLEPSIHKKEWLSRQLATAIRNEEIRPRNSKKFLKIYCLSRSEETLKLTRPIFTTREELLTLNLPHADPSSQIIIRLLDSEFLI